MLWPGLCTAKGNHLISYGKEALNEVALPEPNDTSHHMSFKAAGCTRYHVALLRSLILLAAADWWRGAWGNALWLLWVHSSCSLGQAMAVGSLPCLPFTR